MVLQKSSSRGASGQNRPRVRSSRTDSGIEIWHVEDYTVPVVAVEFAFLGGAAQDPEGRCGLGNLLAGLMDEGAGLLRSHAFQEALEEKAIELSFEATLDRIDGSLRTLAENVPAAFELLALALTSPRFDADAVDRTRAQIISGLKRDESDPGARARDVLSALAYPGHSYGRPADGRIPELAAITRDDVVAQYGRLFARDNLHIVAVGAISEAALVRAIEGAFGPLPKSPALSNVSPIAMRNAGKLEIVDLDIPQSTLYLALPGVARKDPAHMPAMILNHILGGGTFTSRFWIEIREKRGLAYSVWSTLMSRCSSALFLAGTATGNERAAELLALMRAEIDRIAKEGVGTEEFEKAKRFLMGSYALRFDSSRKIAHQLLEISVEGLGIDYIERRNAEVANVTLEEMHEVGRRLFLDARPLVVAAGRPKGLS